MASLENHGFGRRIEFGQNRGEGGHVWPYPVWACLAISALIGRNTVGVGTGPEHKGRFKTGTWPYMPNRGFTKIRPNMPTLGKIVFFENGTPNGHARPGHGHDRGKWTCPHPWDAPKGRGDVVLIDWQWNVLALEKTRPKERMASSVKAFVRGLSPQDFNGLKPLRYLRK